MPATSILHIALRLVVTALVASGALMATARQDLPSDTPDGTVLTGDETTALLNTIKERLDSVQQPSGWIDALLKDLPGVRFADDLGDTQAMYQPVSQGPLGRSGDTLYLRAGMNLNNLTNSQLGVITHEMWHAWFDFVPTYVPLVGSNVGRMSNAQDEAMGGFIEQLAMGNTLGDAISGAIAEILNWNGTVQDAVNAIDIVEKYFGGSFFANGLPTDRDVLLWARVRHRYPEVLDLEERYLSDADQRRVAAQVAIMVVNDARADEPLVEPTPEPAPTPPPTPAAAPVPDPPSPSPEEEAAAVEAAINAAAAAASAAVDAAAAAAAAIPDCTPCVPIAQKLSAAKLNEQKLQTEADQITRRLGQIPAEVRTAQQTRDDLRAEYERRLRQTRVTSGSLEARYYEVGSTVYIGLGATRGGKFVPDVVPDPNAPQDFGNASGPRPSPYMTRLKAKLDAADTVLAGLRAEQDRLNTRLKQLTSLLAATRTAVETLQRELDACLKTCGHTGPRVDFGAVTLPPLRPTAVASAAVPDGPVSILSGNPTDLLSRSNLYALQVSDSVPYAIAPPGDPIDDQYQMFVATFIRAGGPAATPAGITSRGAATGSIAMLASAAPGLTTIGGQDRTMPALSIVATGASSGDALTLEILDAGGRLMEIVAPDGLVLQAVEQGAAQTVGQSGQPIVSTSVTGFCLDYSKPPPPPGTIYQVAPNAVQQRYRAMRPVLEAGRALAEAGLLNADSDPDAYATFIQQWAAWTQLEGWDEAAFTREFVAHTQRNLEEAGQTFTADMRDTLVGVAPNRFRDILAVLVEADGLTGRLPFLLES